MSDIELNINYLVACIDSINQLKDIPAADELKSLVNSWVDKKVADTINDPSTALKVYCNWMKMADDSSPDPMVAWLITMPEAESSNEITSLLHTWVSQKLAEALSQPENKMTIFRSWLAISPTNVSSTFDIVLEPPVEEEAVGSSADTGPLTWPRW